LFFCKGLYSETYTEERLRTRGNVSPTSSEKHRVRQMIDRLESSSSSSNTKTTKQFSRKKSFHEDHSEGLTNLTSSPSINRITRRENHDYNLTNGTNGSFVFRPRSPHGDKNSNVTRFELDRNEILNGGRRTASGTTVSYYSKKKNQISFSLLDR